MTDNTGICIRPSSVNTFLQCPQQWYQVFIKGRTSIPNARAAIGTAIHKAAEQMWSDAIVHKEKNPNLSAMTDAAMEAFKEEGKKGLSYEDGENAGTASVEIIKGTETYIDDIVPFVSIPLAVESRVEIAITDHPIVSALGGTIDHLESDALSDIKTSKRTPTPGNYTIQQSLYKYLAIANGYLIEHTFIQAVVLTKVPKGAILQMPIDMDLAKASVNSLLDTTEVYAKDIVNPDILFRGNPEYYLCSAKYCAFYNECKFVRGDAAKKTAKDAAVIASTEKQAKIQVVNTMDNVKL